MCLGAGEKGAAIAAGMAQEEARIKPGSLHFYRAALPAGPILVLGFICLEGVEVSANPPAAACIFLSMICTSSPHLAFTFFSQCSSTSQQQHLWCSCSAWELSPTSCFGPTSKQCT